MKKTTSLLLSVLVTVLTLFFGSHTYTVESTGSSNYCVQQTATSTTPDFVPTNEEEGDDDDQEDFSQEGSSSQESVSSSGIYIGQIDNNSLEISIDSKPTAFFMSDTVKAALNPNTLSKNTHVKLQYIKSVHGQNFLTKLEIDK